MRPLLLRAVALALHAVLALAFLLGPCRCDWRLFRVARRSVEVDRRRETKRLLSLN